MNVPDDVQYSSDHEWVRNEDGKARVGITDYAQDALGDVVFVQVPTVGDTIDAGGSLGEIESTKSVSEIYAPIAARVVEVNSELEASPELVNSEPYGAGWIAVLEPIDVGELASLMSPDEYRQLTEG